MIGHFTGQCIGLAGTVFVRHVSLTQRKCLICFVYVSEVANQQMSRRKNFGGSFICEQWKIEEQFLRCFWQ